MTPVYSKNGCLPCKHRKKKCCEKKPRCNQCIRLGIICSYNNPGVIRRNNTILLNLREVGYWQVASPLLQVRNLQPIKFRNCAEEAIVRRVPPLLSTFWSVACNDATRDLKLFLQFILQDRLVRDAAVTCFSGILDTGSWCRYLHYASYGRFLTSIREVFASNGNRNTSYTAVLIALTFAGTRESTSPDSSHDIFLHWNALLTLLHRPDPIECQDPPGVSKTVCLWVYEGILYHLSRIGIFSASLLSLAKKWDESRLYARLMRSATDSVQRVQQSPVMNGQYQLSNIILEVTCLHRSQGPGKVSSDRLHSFEMQLQQYELLLGSQFRDLAAPIRRALRHEYSISCNSLRICILALHSPSAEMANAIDLTASQNLSYLLGLPTIETNHFGLLWAIQILACALRVDFDVNRLGAYFDSFSLSLDPGHRLRAQKLFSRIRQIKAERRMSSAALKNESAVSDHIPIGLSLLQHRDGILS